MAKIAVLKIESDQLNRGYIVSVQVLKPDRFPSEFGQAHLPDGSEIDSYYTLWQAKFRGLSLRSGDDDDWQVESKGITHRSTLEGKEACRQYAKQVEERMQAWLRNSRDLQWQTIRERLIRELERDDDELYIVVQSSAKLWKLPWHCWDLLENYPHVGLGFSFLNPDRTEIVTKSVCHDRVRILAIFGDDSKIDLEPDRQSILNLEKKDADIIFLDKPTASELIEKVRDKEGWDILFFAGHSETKEQIGRIYINETESLEIYQFKNALREAFCNGLKILIFNSCQGLGLVEEIYKLGIPHVIFMHENVPDLVAQFFLKELLSEYAEGKSLYAAFNLARDRLEQFTDTPGVTWLPKLYQNLEQIAPTWSELRGNVKAVLTPSEIAEPKREAKKRSPLSDRKHLSRVILISILVTAVVMGMRWFGLLQTSELQAFDRLIQQRPAEEPDPRILVVGADEADIVQYGAPLPDKIIAATLEKLQQYKPLVIGLDIYRDITIPKEPKPLELISHFQTNPKLISVCKYYDKEGGKVAPPPQSIADAVGFVNLMLDKPDDTVRLYPLIRSENSDADLDKCKTKTSLAFLLAYQYLEEKNIPYKKISDKELQLGEVSFKKLIARSAAYQKIDDKGFQVIINYRASKRQDRNISRSVTIGEILSAEFEPNWIENNIILVGVTAPSLKDVHMTPFDEKIPGVWIHAHMVSQILSAVENKRFLIWWLPIWGDALWIEIWSLIGGILVFYWQFNRRLRSGHLILGISMCLVTLYSLCLFLFIIQAAWLPLIPSALALFATGITVVIYFFSRTRNLN